MRPGAPPGVGTMGRKGPRRLAEDQEILVRQEAVLLGERVARASELGADLRRRDALLLRRTRGRSLAGVDHGQASAGLQRAPEPAEIRLAVRDVVVHVDE